MVKLKACHKNKFYEMLLAMGYCGETNVGVLVKVILGFNEKKRYCSVAFIEMARSCPSPKSETMFITETHHAAKKHRSQRNRWGPIWLDIF